MRRGRLFSHTISVISGRTKISSWRRIVIMRGMPLEMQVTRVSRPWPPAFWSAMLASQSLRYSAVSGGSCGRPGRLLSSQAFTVPSLRFHWPSKLGYFDSSNAAAPEIVVNSAAVSAIAPIRIRWKVMTVPLVIDPTTGELRLNIHRLRVHAEGCAELGRAPRFRLEREVG